MQVCTHAAEPPAQPAVPTAVRRTLARGFKTTVEWAVRATGCDRPDPPLPCARARASRSARALARGAARRRAAPRPARASCARVRSPMCRARARAARRLARQRAARARGCIHDVAFARRSRHAVGIAAARAACTHRTFAAAERGGRGLGARAHAQRARLERMEHGARALAPCALRPAPCALHPAPCAHYPPPITRRARRGAGARAPLPRPEHASHVLPPILPSPPSNTLCPQPARVEQQMTHATIAPQLTREPTPATPDGADGARTAAHAPAARRKGATSLTPPLTPATDAAAALRRRSSSKRLWRRLSGWQQLTAVLALMLLVAGLWRVDRRLGAPSPPGA